MVHMAQDAVDTVKETLGMSDKKWRNQHFFLLKKKVLFINLINIYYSNLWILLVIIFYLH